MLTRKKSSFATSIFEILLDTKLHIMFCDFQGLLKFLITSGGASENAEPLMPRSDKTFVSAIRKYYTTVDEAKFEELYNIGEFPALDPGVGGNLVWKCCDGKYESVCEVVNDFEVLEPLL